MSLLTEQKIGIKFNDLSRYVDIFRPTHKISPLCHAGDITYSTTNNREEAKPIISGTALTFDTNIQGDTKSSTKIVDHFCIAKYGLEVFNQTTKMADPAIHVSH
jgi:hypothetical protein